LKGVDYVMRDLAENLAVLDTLDALQRTVAEYDGGEIDLAAHGYPRKILIVVSVGAVLAGGTLDIDIESDEDSGLPHGNTDASLNQMDAAGNQIYEYKPTRRYINIEAVVGTNTIDFGVVLIMEHCRFGGRGSDD
jgi:hypothetical protein